VIVEIFAGLAAGEMAGIATGLYIGRKLIIKYKRQRNTAVDMLDDLESGEGEEPVHGKPKENFQAEGSTLSLERLVNLPPSTRVKIELARLADGLPPRDPLNKLPPDSVERIMVTRIKEGWEE